MGKAPWWSGFKESKNETPKTQTHFAEGFVAHRFMSKVSIGPTKKRVEFHPGKCIDQSSITGDHHAPNYYRAGVYPQYKSTSQTFQGKTVF